MERKLTAILSADVKGYSRLMGENDEATIRTLTSYRAVMTTLIREHRGRVVDSPGDNLLAEFASAVDAVQGAVAIQHELQRRNAELPANRKMEFRIGVNLGDVVVEDGRLYGDGVNIAARLEALAEMERAVALDPNEAWSYAALAEVLSRMGRTEDALKAAGQALRLKSALADNHLGSIGAAYAVSGRYEEARAPLQRFLSRYPNILPAHLTLAAVYSELGQAAEARAEAAEVLRLNPNFLLEIHKQRMPIKDPAGLERHLVALRKAGLK